VDVPAHCESARQAIPQTEAQEGHCFTHDSEQSQSTLEVQEARYVRQVPELPPLPVPGVVFSVQMHPFAMTQEACVKAEQVPYGVPVHDPDQTHPGIPAQSVGEDVEQDWPMFVAVPTQLPLS
jgi:hypothetical protein